jgi:putative peptide zinc metalloprotease protein
MDIVPAFRSELKLVPQNAKGGDGFFIKDPQTQRVFEIGEKEHFLCQQLDGRTGLRTIQERFESRFGKSLPLQDIQDFVRHLEFEGLLAGSIPRPQAPAPRPSRERPEWKVKLMDADRLFAWLASRLGWCFTRAFFSISLFMPLTALYVLLGHWGEFSRSLVGLGRFPSVLVVGAIGFLFLNLPRQIAYGLACKYYGEPVREIGLRLVHYLIPLFYCDALNPLWFRNRSGRLQMMFAGGYCQLLVWGFGIIGWKLSPPGAYRHSFFLLLSFAATLALLFNWNPLGRRDGGLLVGELSGIWNLRGRALSTALAWIFRRPMPEPLRRGQLWGFRIFGLLVAVFLLLLVYAFTTMVGGRLTAAYEGAGALLFLALLFYFLRRPLMRCLQRPVSWLLASQAGAVSRWFVRLFWLVLFVGVMFIPYPYETGGPFTILPSVRTEIHCEIDGGRIEQVFVREGDSVKAGQPLAQIDRSDYEKNLQATQAQLDSAGARLQLLRRRLAILDQPPNIEEIQTLEAEIRRLRVLLSDYRRQLDLTTLRAPIAGRVITAVIQQRVGQYLKRGDLFATVEQAETVRVEIQVPEEDAPQVRVGARVAVAPWAYANEKFYGTVAEIAPVAAVDPSQAASRSVRVIAELPNEGLRLKSYLTGYAKIKAEKVPVWFVLWRPLLRWFQVEVWYWVP